MTVILDTFQYVSDTCLDVSKTFNLPVLAPYLILAGDIGWPNQLSYWNFLKTCSANYQMVFLVLGDREHQVAKWGFIPDFIREHIKKNLLLNVILLDNQSYDVVVNKTKYRLIGSTFWSYLSRPQEYVKCYERIRYIDPLTNNWVSFTEKVNELNVFCTNWLRGQIDLAKDRGMKVIGITHFPPSSSLVHPDYWKEEYTQFYYNPADFLLKDHVEYWVFGHAKARGWKKIGNTICVTNAQGEPGWIPKFLESPDPEPSIPYNIGSFHLNNSGEDLGDELDESAFVDVTSFVVDHVRSKDVGNWILSPNAGDLVNRFH